VELQAARGALTTWMIERGCRQASYCTTGESTRWPRLAPRPKRWRSTATGFPLWGGSEEVKSSAIPSTVMVGLQGRTVLPGFTDSHVHLLSYALTADQVDLEGVKTIEEAGERVGRRVSRLGDGKWVLGRGWDRNLWRRDPRKEDLDEVSPRNPVAPPLQGRAHPVSQLCGAGAGRC